MVKGKVKTKNRLSPGKIYKNRKGAAQAPPLYKEISIIVYFAVYEGFRSPALVRTAGKPFRYRFVLKPSIDARLSVTR